MYILVLIVNHEDRQVVNQVIYQYSTYYYVFYAISAYIICK